MANNKIQKLFKKRVQGTVAYAIIVNETVTAGMLPAAVAEVMAESNRKIYMTSRVIKHLYDKKPAEEFDFVLINIPGIIARPDYLYRNKGDKRGQFCLMKRIEDREYFISLEVINSVYGKETQIATAFRVRSKPYLEEHDLSWSRRDGETHSS